LVEDDPLVRRANHRALVALGYAVTSVESSEAALALDALDQFSLLISDVRLPGVPGTALAVELSRRYPNLAVLLVSGFAEAGPEDANAEAFCFLRKPFTPGVLADRIRELLDPREG
jgi:DNA-binding NtrC family response regulator